MNKQQITDIIAKPGFWKEYLPLLATSIKVTLPTNHVINSPHTFVNCKGWNDNRDGYSWASRASRWYQNVDVHSYDTSDEELISPRKQTSADYNDNIPLFPTMVMKAANKLRQTARNNTPYKDNPKTQEKPMINKFKNTADSVLNTNKDAVQIALQIGTGKTANRFFIGKLVAKLPWYSKMFGGKKKVEDNAIAKLVAAETAATMIKHFAPNNKKLNYIADGMIQDAVVDVTVNSKTFEKMITELEGLVSLPDFDGNL